MHFFILLFAYFKYLLYLCSMKKLLEDYNSLGKNINRAAKKLPILKKNHKK